MKTIKYKYRSAIVAEDGTRYISVEFTELPFDKYLIGLHKKYPGMRQSHIELLEVIEEDDDDAPDYADFIALKAVYDGPYQRLAVINDIQFEW